MKRGVTRRDFLWALPAGVVAWLLGKNPVLRRAAAPDRTLAAATKLVGLFRDPARAAAVGRAYLRVAPDEARVAPLLAALVASGPNPAAWLKSASQEQMRRHMSCKIKRDFAEERLVQVEGWLLARSEARAYALAAMIERSPTEAGTRKRNTTT